MEAIAWSDQVRFHPWIGSGYWLGNPYGGKLLALGESQYSDNVNEPPDVTQRLIAETSNDEWRARFFTTVASVISGKSPHDLDRKQFWPTISFYNYIQQIVGIGPRDRPTQQMWDASVRPFEEILLKLAPNYLVVFGNELWEKLPEWPDGPVVNVNDKERRTCQFINSKNEKCLAINVPHPAWPGFGSCESWHQLVATAFNLPGSGVGFPGA